MAESRRTTPTSRVCAWLILLACAAPAAARQESPAIDLEALRAHGAAWLMTGLSGDRAQGEADAEQLIWPMWYLHWRPASEVGGTLAIDQVPGIVEGLWEDFVIDGPVEPRAVSLRAHEAFLAEGTTQRGAMRHRWIVWICPESGRLIVVDAGLSLQLNASPELFDLMESMARTVRCHRDAPVDSHPLLTLDRVVPRAEIAFHHPFTWRPLEGYRMVRRFGDTDLRVANSEEVTTERGQDLVLAMDAHQRLHFEWGPQPDVPVTWEYLQARASSYWIGRSRDLMPVGRSVQDDVWVFEGIVRMAGGKSTMPPTHMHKFRAWLWRRDGTEYLAVGSVAGVYYGPRRPGLEYEEWGGHFEALRAACRY